MKKYDLITPIVLILSGLLLLFIPGGIINTVISIFGIIIIALGALSIIEAVKSKQSNIGIAYGILMSILGIVFISSPNVIAGIIPLILGIWILIKSAIRLQYVFFLKDSGSEEWIKAMIVNILTLILGMVLIFNPFKGAETIMRIIGIFMIIYAILDISEYYMTKPKKVKVIK